MLDEVLSSPRLQVTLLALAICVGASPFWAGTYWPFQDAPQHHAMVQILRDYHSADLRFFDTYTRDWAPFPYWGFYGPALLLSYVVDVHTAACLVMSAMIGGLVLGLRSVLSAFGREPLLAVLAVPLAFNNNLFVGFFSYMTGLPMMLFAISHAEGWFRSGEIRRGATAACFATATYACHGHVFLMLVCCVGLLWIAHGLPWRRLWPFVPGALLLIWWLGIASGGPGADMPPYHREQLMGAGHAEFIRFDGPVRVRLERLPGYGWDVHVGHVDEAAFALLALGVFLLWVRRTRPRLDEGLPRWRRQLHRYRLEVMACALFSGSLLLPQSVGWLWLIAGRHVSAGLLLVVAAFAGARTSGRLNASLVGVLVVVSLVTPLWFAGEFRAHQRTLQPFDRLRKVAPAAQNRLCVIGASHAIPPWRNRVLVHVCAYLQSDTGGALGFSFAGLPNIPVRYKPDKQTPFPNIWHPREFRPHSYLRHYDQIVIQGSDRHHRTLSAQATQILTEGRWRLYHLQ